MRVFWTILQKPNSERAKPLPYIHDKHILLGSQRGAHTQLQSEKGGEIQRKIILFGWPNRHLTNEIERANGQLNWRWSGFQNRPRPRFPFYNHI